MLSLAPCFEIVQNSGFMGGSLPKNRWVRSFVQASLTCHPHQATILIANLGYKILPLMNTLLPYIQQRNAPCEQILIHEGDLADTGKQTGSCRQARLKPCVDIGDIRINIVTRPFKGRCFLSGRHCSSFASSKFLEVLCFHPMSKFGQALWLFRGSQFRNPSPSAR